MTAFIDRTGQTFNKLQITAELGKGRVTATCILCGSEKEYSKSRITCGVVKACGCKPKRFIDRTGQIFNNLKIIQEIGGERVIAECLICESKKEYRKADIVCSHAKSCGCIPGGFIDRTGQIFNSLQITKELGYGKVISRCLLCGSTKEYKKVDIVSRNKKCECIPGFRIDRTGQTFNNLQIIKELGNDKVICKCLSCGSEKEFSKNNVAQGTTKSCGCENHKVSDRTEQIFGDLQIIKELSNNKVICKCLMCSKESEYIKSVLTNRGTECKNCGLERNYKGRITNSIKVLDLAYTGRNKNKYYNCECIKCGEGMVLTREEIVKYTCDKGV